MRRIKKGIFLYFLSMSLLFSLAIGSAAQQGGGKGRPGGSSDDGLMVERSSSETSGESRELKEKALERMDQARHRGETEQEEAQKGLEKQREKKLEQEQKETGKGSEQGQQKREEHRRKWWKFWE